MVEKFIEHYDSLFLSIVCIMNSGNNIFVGVLDRGAECQQMDASERDFYAFLPLARMVQAEVNVLGLSVTPCQRTNIHSELREAPNTDA